jgi:hypothetical protein
MFDYGTKAFHLEGEQAEIALASSGQYINSTNLANDASIYRLNESIINGEGETEFDCDKPIDISQFDRLVLCGYIP